MTDKHASKQRRAAQNRREREARAARVARARSENGAADGPSSPSRTGGSSRTAGARRTRGAGSSRSRRAGTSRGGAPSATADAAEATGRPSRSDRTAARRNRWRDSDSPTPGARSVLMAFLMALGAAAMLFFLPVTPVERERDGRQVIETTSLLDEAGAIPALAYLAVPVLIAGAAWFATRWPDRRKRVYLVAAAMQILWVVLNIGGVGLLFTVSAIGLALGAWQALQAERLQGADEHSEDPSIDR